MSALHERVHAFADGELNADEAAEFRDHLADCASCQSELETIMQLSAFGFAEREAQAAKAGVTPIAFWRRPRTIATATSLLAAAAVLALFVRTRTSDDLLAPGSVRHMEARSSYAGADRWRRYDVDRASTSQHERPSLKKMAELEEHGDWRGLAAAYLLAGDGAQATAALDKAGHSPESENDRAVLALEKGDFESSIELSDAALRAQPTMTQALWNRAIAERELGLEHQAAKSFAEVAAKNEPGWADEARERSGALQKKADADRTAWDALLDAGDKMVAGGAVLPLELVRTAPGMSRHFLWQALRTATSAERVRSLLPLGQEIDRLDHGDELARNVRQIAAADFSLRAPLAALYLPLAQGKVPDDKKAQRALVDRFEKAGQKDLALGALQATNLAAESVDEFRQLARALDDRSYIGMADYYAAGEQQARGDVAAAAQTLLGSLGECEKGGGIEERCAFNELAAAYPLVEMHRVAEAHQHVLDAWKRARRVGDRDLQGRVLIELSEMQLLANHFALVRAYSGEDALRNPKDEDVQRYVHETKAAADVYDLQPDAARAELAAIAKTGGWLDGNGLWALADLAHLGLSPAEKQLGIASATSLRKLPGLNGGFRALIDFFEGRLIIGDEPERGQKLLEKAIADGNRLPADDADAQKARAFSYGTLVAESASHKAWPAVLKLLADEARLPQPERCVVGVAIDNERDIAVSIGNDGVARGSITSRRSSAVNVADFVPADQLTALGNCAEVTVLARPPLYGSPNLLPSTLAWSYRSHHDLAGAPPKSERRVVISDVEPPSSLGLAKLATWRAVSSDGGGVELQGAAATPSRVLREIANATEIVFDAHGLVDAGQSDATMLALSPDANGRFALGVAELRPIHLTGAPVVVLAACRAADLIVPSPHEPNSLPVGFLNAGARAVMASSQPISDADAGSFFDGVRRRAASGVPLAIALQKEKQEWRTKSPWTQQVMLFE